ncbi:hypothetical protein [Stenotrophomonas rhizophila]|nr:hypothetical protein [Stenotrophomonas rhizophila]
MYRGARDYLLEDTLGTRDGFPVAFDSLDKQVMGEVEGVRCAPQG